MNLTGRSVWQQAAGDTERDFADMCLKHGVVLSGYDSDGVPPPQSDPFELNFTRVLAVGSPPWIDSLQDTTRRKAQLTRFCHNIKANDIVVLRHGTSQVLGVGVVAGEYFHDEHFGDVDGWNVPLGRRVAWLDMPDLPKQFKTYDLKWGDTTQQLEASGAVWKWLESLPEYEGRLTGAYDPKQWRPQQTVGLELISDYLFDKGIASASIRNLLAQMGELERIAKWYQRTQGGPSESETVAYLVVPLLRTLGWTPQKMAVEWASMDLALFSSLPRSKETLRVVVEVKKMNDSCFTAEEQAKGYAAGNEQCHRLILTDGLRYAVYTRKAGEDFLLAAYLNLTRMRDHYPVLACNGAQECLLLMAPEMERPTEDK